MNESFKIALQQIELKGVIEWTDWAQIYEFHPEAILVAEEELGVERSRIMKYITENAVPASILLPRLKHLLEQHEKTIRESTIDFFGPIKRLIIRIIGR